MSKFVLKNGQIVSSEGIFDADVVVEDGKIIEVIEGGGSDLGIEEIDCARKIILPGLIDAHVHFREPGDSYKEDWQTGSSAAASGGVTTVFDMPNNKPPIFSVMELEVKRKMISGRSFVNFGLYMGFNGENFDEVNKAEGIPGVKIYCAHSTGKIGVGEEHIEKAFSAINRDKLLLFHAEDEECIEQHRAEVMANGEDVEPIAHSKIRDPECAVKMVKKLCELAKEHDRPIHICHVSTEAEIDVINEYRSVGVTCEVAPHHLVLSENDYEYLGNFIKVNPPLRTQANVFGLWKCLKMGMIDIIATDHAPHTIEDKELPYVQVPSGVPGVEMMLPILLNTVNNDGLTLEEVVKLCCERPAEIFKLEGKGKIEKGFDADLVVIDMDMERTFHNEDVLSKCGWSPYADSVFRGWPIMTFINGQLVFENGKIVGNPLGNDVMFS